MAAERSHGGNRALGLGGAIGVHALLVALLVLFGSRGAGPPAAASPALVAVPLTQRLPPPPPPERATSGEAASPSRGRSDPPSAPPPPAPLARPTPAEISIDAGSGQASGAGTAAGSGAGQGGEGAGRGAGGPGAGSGGGRATPPVRIAGELTNADYRRARAPAGAAGTVVVDFRVRADGAVDRCAVLRSSGVAAFDAATCRLIEQRFRFRPALDPAGRPIDYQIRTEYTWTPR
jgi:protein TonB